MADGGLKIELGDDLSQEVKAAAAAKGVSVEAFVRAAVADKVFAEVDCSDDPDPAIDDKIADEALSTGNTIPWSQVRPWVESWGKPKELPLPKWRK